MRYECDCGAFYTNTSGVEACQLNNHGIARPPRPLQVFVALGHHVNDTYVIGVYRSQDAAEKAAEIWITQMEAEFPEGMLDTDIDEQVVQDE